MINDPVPPEVAAELQDYKSGLRQLLYNRGVTELFAAESFLKSSGSLYDPFDLKNMDVVVARIWRALEEDEPVAVYGDYDVDGVTATALLVQVLRRLGADARAYIPHRFDEGYGLNNDALDTLKAHGVKLVITVDCGIRSPREAEYAREIGLDLIISDHHEPAEYLPDALAVICPKQAGDSYPCRDLAGVGLAYKIVEALLKAHPAAGMEAEDWLDLVAVGTVADVVPLTHENRSLVRAGLLRLRLGRRPGLAALAGASGLHIPSLNAHDIGFMIGPRLNAAGRLDSALAAYELLMAPDSQQAGLLAQKLDDQNRDRQEITRQLQALAETQFAPDDGNFLLYAVNPEFNKGVVGLVAAKLAEAHYRPAVVGQQDEEFTRASCRSIPEFHITRALDQCADLLVRHGGHAMAAGFTVRNEHVEELGARLREIAARELADLDLRPVLHADMELPLKNLRPDLLNVLDQMEPTGAGNAEPAFVCRGAVVKGVRTMGKEGTHLRFQVSDPEKPGVWWSAVAFRQSRWAQSMPERVDLLYTFGRNFYNGTETLQINVRDIRAAE